MGEIRATSGHEKETRKRHILGAATELLRRWSYTDITMDRIAEQAGIAKGTLYLYFRTKEALFLKLYEECLVRWYSELKSLAAQDVRTVGSSTAARAIVSSLSAQPTLIHLHGLLYSSLSRNIDVESALSFRRRQQQSLVSVAASLAGRIKGLSKPQALQFLVRLEIVVGGLYWAAFPSSPIIRSLEEEDLAPFRIDFEEELREIVTVLLP